MDLHQTGKTCLVTRSDKFECQGQRSRLPGSKTAFLALSAASVWFMFGKTSVTSSYFNFTNCIIIIIIRFVKRQNVKRLPWCFNTVDWASQRASRGLKIEWWGAGMVIGLEWDAYGPADATATLSSLASLKSRIILPFWCQLSQVVMERRPLNGCLYQLYQPWFRISILPAVFDFSHFVILQHFCGNECSSLCWCAITALHTRSLIHTTITETANNNANDDNHNKEN